MLNSLRFHQHFSITYITNVLTNFCKQHFRTSPSAITVVTGTTTLNSGGTAYYVSRIVNHPQYNPQTTANDISLVRTSSTIALSSNVNTIPISSGNIGSGYTAVLSGWGSTAAGGALPNNLQFINLRTIDTNACASQLSPNPVYTSNICTFTQTGQGACNGDSGGPLVVQGILVGVVSWGRPCAVGFPDVFTRVSSYVEWILNNAT